MFIIPNTMNQFLHTDGSYNYFNITDFMNIISSIRNTNKGKGYDEIKYNVKDLISKTNDTIQIETLYKILRYFDRNIVPFGEIGSKY